MASGKPAGANASTAFRVCEKLRGPLGKIMGVGGFHSLLARAVRLSGAEAPWLRAVQIAADGSLEDLNRLEAEQDGRAGAAGEAVLVAELLGLLVTFIGSDLTLRLLHEIWPKMEDLNF